MLAQVSEAADFDPEEFDARVADQAVKDRLKAGTEQDRVRAVFGAPSYFIGADMLFGQDRPHFVAELVGRGRFPTPRGVNFDMQVMALRVRAGEFSAGKL